MSVGLHIFKVLTCDQHCVFVKVLSIGAAHTVSDTAVVPGHRVIGHQ